MVIKHIQASWGASHIRNGHSTGLGQEVLVPSMRASKSLLSFLIWKGSPHPLLCIKLHHRMIHTLWTNSKIIQSYEAGFTDFDHSVAFPALDIDPEDMMKYRQNIVGQMTSGFHSISFLQVQVFLFVVWHSRPALFDIYPLWQSHIPFQSSLLSTSPEGPHSYPNTICLFTEKSMLKGWFSSPSHS